MTLREAKKLLKEKSLEYLLRRDDINWRDESPDNAFHIEELDDRYRLHNLEYNNGIYAVDWSKKLLDGGNPNTQEEWMDLTKDTEFKLASMPLYHSTIMALFNNQEHPDDGQAQLVQEVRKMLQQDFKKYLMMTSSGIRYAGRKSQTAKDIIIHDWNTKNAREIKGSFVGKDGWIKPGFAEETMEAILEANGFAMVWEAYEWIGEEGKKPYLWRLNHKPKKETERPLVLGVIVYDRFFIDAYNFDSDRPARGVVIGEPKAQKMTRTRKSAER